MDSGDGNGWRGGDRWGTAAPCSRTGSWASGTSGDGKARLANGEVVDAAAKARSSWTARDRSAGLMDGEVVDAAATARSSWIAAGIGEVVDAAAAALGEVDLRV